MKYITFIFKGNDDVYDNANYIYKTADRSYPTIKLNEGEKYTYPEDYLINVPNEYIEVISVSERFPIPSIAAPTSRRISIDSPAGFSWTTHPLVDKLYFDTSTYKFGTTFDITTLQNVAEGTTYFVRKDGLDTNDGLTWDTAFKTVWKAVGMPNRKRIYVGPGIYNRNEGFQGVVITKPLEVIGIGDVTFGQYDNLSWTLTAGQTKTYQATRSSVNRVFDSKTVDSNGDYAELVLKTSIAEVEANPGSWYTDGSKVYVHTSNDRAADSSIFAYMNIAGFTAMNGEYYLENIKFEGGSLPIKIDSNVAGKPAKFYAKDVSVKYAGTGNGWNFLGTESILVNCVAAKSLDDGFNYHLSTNLANNSKAIEIYCVGRDNGISSDTDNGSTMHDGGSIIRIGTECMRNKGPNFADVTTGTESWNVDCYGHHSTGGSTQGVDFQASDGTAGAVKAWYENCRSTGSNSLYNLGIMNAGSVVKIRNCVLPVKTGPGATTAY